ncbi:uncharacterized protein TNCV_4732351 [Trichonephila clavipes]|nr:uncharacterized protein TNCV_4732351 [Trichonephila clavipes]
MRTSTFLTLTKVELLRTLIAVYRIAQLLFVSGEIQLPLAEYEIDGFKTAGFQRPSITSSLEDRHVTHMALTDRSATSRALSYGVVCKSTCVCTNSSATFVAAWTLSSETMTLLPLTLHHRQERLQWCDQGRIWTHEWRDTIFYR